MIYVNSSGVSIIGLNISKKSDELGSIGIFVRSDTICNNITNISHNYIYNYPRGILIENCDGRINLNDNHILIPSSGQCAQTEPWWGGIGLIRCNNSTITSNIIEGLDRRGHFTDGIYIKSSNDIEVYNNDFINLKCGIIVVGNPNRIRNDPCSPNNSFERVNMRYADNINPIDLCNRW